MAGTISNLGIGYGNKQSSLSGDLIEKLKEADKKIMLDPTKKELESVFAKQKDQKELVNLLSSLRSKGEYFASELTYLKRSTNVIGDGATVKASDGVDVRNGKIHINNIAKNSIIELGGYSSKNAVVATTNSTFTFKVGGKEHEIDLVGGTTLEGLKDAISEAAGDDVVASVLNTGGTDGYKIILKSKETGEDSAITIDSSASSALNITANTIQEAKDASFSVDGIEIKRASNTVTDLFSGVTVELKKDNSDVSFSISKDLSGFSDKMQAFVDEYNKAMQFIAKITKFDDKGKETGSFQGDSRINSIQSSLNSVLFQSDKDNAELNLANMGFELTKDGSMIFDKSKFEKALNNDPAVIEKFFMTKTEVTSSIGVGGVASPITSDTSLSKGTIKINGYEVGAINLLASNTSKQNAQLVVNAINAIKDETGVTANVIGGANQISLVDSTGKFLKIEIANGHSDVMGLKSGAYVGGKKETQGLFSKFDDYMKGLLVSQGSTLGSIESSLKSSEESLTDDLQSTIDRINAKYETMAQQFIAYNKIIAGFESQFSSIKMMIDAQVAAKG